MVAHTLQRPSPSFPLLFVVHVVLRQPNPGPTRDEAWPGLAGLPDLPRVGQPGRPHCRPGPAPAHQGGAGAGEPREQHVLAEEFKLITPISMSRNYFFIKISTGILIWIKIKKCRIERRYQRGPSQEISNSEVNDIHLKVKANLEITDTDVLCLVSVGASRGRGQYQPKRAPVNLRWSSKLSYNRGSRSSAQ